MTLIEDDAFRTAQMFSDENKAVLGLILESTRNEADLRAHLVTISAGTVGLIVPMLSGRPIVKSHWWLTAAAVALIVNIAVAVIITLVSRWFTAAQIFRVGDYYTKTFALLRDYEGMEAAAQIRQHHEAHVRSNKKRLPWMLGLTGLGDLAFYGTLIYGLCALIRSLF